jgi:uncharacterized protein YjeT (DUF2065 family)
MQLITILYTIGAIACLEGLSIALFPDSMKKIVTKIFKHKTKIRKLGITELVVGLILILIAYLL